MKMHHSAVTSVSTWGVLRKSLEIARLRIITADFVVEETEGLEMVRNSNTESDGTVRGNAGKMLKSAGDTFLHTRATPTLPAVHRVDETRRGISSS